MMEHSERKGLVKQYTHQAERVLNEYQYSQNLAEKKYMLGQAMEKINLAIETGENTMVTARAYCIRAKIHMALGDSKNAFTDIDRAIELNPNYMELCQTRKAFLFDAGNICLENGEFENAIKYYTESIDAGIDPPWVYGKRALAHAKAGNIREAEQDKETANLPDWFCSMHPMFYEVMLGAIRNNDPEFVKYIPPGEDDFDNPNGTIVYGFGLRFCSKGYDAKTGKLIWLS